METCYINLFFLYRFEAIFNECFNIAYTIDKEPMWHHMSELQANFKAPTYNVLGGALAPMDKERVDSHPKMLLFALDELSYVYQRADNTDVRRVIAYEMLSFVSHRCMEWQNGRLKPEHDTHGSPMPHVNLGNIGSLERLAWAIYDRIYVPGNEPTLSGLCDWTCVLNKTIMHTFHGRMLWSTAPKHCWRLQCGHHCPPERGPSSKAVQERELAEETQASWAPASPASKTRTLWSVMNVPSGATSAHADGGAMTTSLDLGEEDDDEPFHEFNWHRMQ